MNHPTQSSSNTGTTRITSATLMRLAGLSAAAAGLGFVVVGLFHPLNVPSSVTTATWINVHLVAVAMGFFGLLGLVGIYARQVEKAGWLGLAGFVLFGTWLALIMAFSLVEALILPSLAAALPSFTASFLGIFTGTTGEIELGGLAMLWTLSGPMLILGTLLFGIATIRAAILPRGAAALLTCGALLIPAGAFLPPAYEPLVLVPIGLALAWLGYALWSERRSNRSAPAPSSSATVEPRNVA